MSPLEGENQWKLYYYTCKWCLFLGTVASLKPFAFHQIERFFVLVFSKSSGQTRSPFMQSLRRIAVVWNTEFQNLLLKILFDTHGTFKRYTRKVKKSYVWPDTVLRTSVKAEFHLGQGGVWSAQWPRPSRTVCVTEHRQRLEHAKQYVRTGETFEHSHRHFVENEECLLLSRNIQTWIPDVFVHNNHC